MSRNYIVGMTMVIIGLLVNIFTSPRPFTSLFIGEYYGVVLFWGGLGIVFGVFISKQK